MRLSRVMPVAFIALVALAPAPDARPATPAEQARSAAIAQRVHPLPRTPTWALGLDPRNVGAAAEADFRGCLDEALACQVRYDPQHFASASFALLCSWTVHEFGHLAGWTVNGAWHATDPRSNMHAVAAHHPACGLSDSQRTRLEARRATLADILRDLRAEGRRTRRLARRYRQRIARIDARLTRLP